MVEVDGKSVKLQGILSRGIITDVWAGKLDVAVKTLKPGRMTQKAFLEEAELMYRLRHPKLVQLIAVCTKPSHIITELMVNGALLDYLRKDQGRTITFNIITNMAGQIADGMAYLEAENCVHRDLRAANILVGEHHEVKVADFFRARFIQDDFYEAPENTILPTKWIAPEAAFDRKFSIKSDVWSYGVLLYELITFGSVPYPGMNSHVVLNRVKKGFRMPRPTDGPIPCPDPYYEHMLKCWNRSPETRPNFAYLQDFFNSYMLSAEG
ncbi:tyrosine-protein kinase SRK3-like [Dreissena polymorpha]|uniref:tyrosine-protein kinase SRK3-like n=1 Tax=Dreissena polymorpha TaxID=45954 RepID=UPI002263DE5C|nr:tyrosine-protein kinase SRK3-like [Dreissena polymorpha]